MRLKLWKMKPMRPRRSSLSWSSRKPATFFPSNQYSPPSGVSSMPMIDSSVVLPQPEGPMTATYSPAWISRLMLLSAVVMTSPPMNFLVVLTNLSMAPRYLAICRRSTLPNDAVVGNDHALAGFEARGDFDLAVVAAAEADGPALGRSSVARHHEHPGAAGVVDEGIVGQDQARAALAEREARFGALPRAHAAGRIPHEQQFDGEAAVVDLRKHAADGRRDSRAR